jgi:hypothetical protein
VRSKVYLAVEERAFGELARFGRARTELQDVLDNQAQDGRAAVTVQLEHVLAGMTVRRTHDHRQRLIEHRAIRAEQTDGVEAMGRPVAPATVLNDARRDGS